MYSLEDFEVISILGTHLNSTYYKVKNKTSGEGFIWKAINYEYSNDSKDLIKRIAKRKLEDSENGLKVHDYIIHDESVTIYLIIDYCEYGSLYSIISKCIKNDECIEESFLWYLIYRLAKLAKEFGSVNMHDVFINDQYNVKHLNFPLNSNPEAVTNSFSEILHMLIHRQTKYSQNEEFPTHYSSELKNLFHFLTTETPMTLDAVLCHPTALSKLNYIKNTSIFHKLSKSQIDDIDLEKLYQTKLENLRTREAILKSAEDKLKEKQRNLENREKKISLMERVVKEKISRAELYLKRSREQKASNNTLNKAKIQRTLYDNLDTSFSADCGESVIMPTSKKLNVDNIVKPIQLCRTISERRTVRFKQQSPLKDIHNMKKELAQKVRPNQSDSEKTSESSSEKGGTLEKSKPKKFLLSSMFSKKHKKIANSISSSSDCISGHTYEEIDNKQQNEQKPIGWTEESKRHAFDLLRIMNGGVNSDEFGHQIQHTYL